ncbi:hypothetical protein R9C00_15855 [Flammeovirgaceae bacterium SG7u.111]|nr:hypothetical protein [Flammeovirgaceae bacterium SG7u.132]WPO33177.1 hypothetical protein R9C00_15855 [Flammeovirgaceae bacterium SG7u.111]
MKLLIAYRNSGVFKLLLAIGILIGSSSVSSYEAYPAQPRQPYTVEVLFGGKKRSLKQLSSFNSKAQRFYFQFFLNNLRKYNYVNLALHITLATIFKVFSLANPLGSFVQLPVKTIPQSSKSEYPLFIA